MQKKAFMAAKRAGKDEAAILAVVAQALSDGGKLTNEIETILDGLSVSAPGEATQSADERESVNVKSSGKSALQEIVREFDIKDLNAIEDKMVRGIAKKAFLAAKRTGADKIEAVRKALSDADKLDTNAEELLNSFSVSSTEISGDDNTEKPAEHSEDTPDGKSPISEGVSEVLPLFEITKLNSIDDRMTRGMAKKIFTAGKRAEKSRMEVITDIRDSLKSAGKLDDSTSAILTNLESGN